MKKSRERPEFAGRSRGIFPMKGGKGNLLDTSVKIGYIQRENHRT